MTDSVSPKVANALLQQRESFLRFLQRRVKSPQAAEDILQSSFVKALEKGKEIREDESVVAWFYRVLRNAITDHHRRRSVEDRSLGKKKAELEAADKHAANRAIERFVCRCVKDLIKTIKPEYERVLRRIDLEGAGIEDFARAEKITPNNAMVRLHRARKALHGRLLQSCGSCTRHGCLDCSCKD